MTGRILPIGPLMAARPTPPQPITATVSPGRTFDV